MIERVSEPIGRDPAVQEALSVLERAIVAAAAKEGHMMQTMALVWASAKDGDGYGGSLIKVDTSDDTIEFLVEILRDDSDDIEIPDPIGRRQ